MDRRTLLGALAATTLGLVRPDRLLSAMPPSPTPAAIDRFGLQLYSLRGLMAQSVEKTLASVAELGYREVEFAGYFNRPPRSLRQLLDRNKLAAVAAHTDMGTLRNRWLLALDEAAEIGHKYLIVPSLPTADRNTLDAVKRTAETLNKAGQEAAKYKITVGFHNHAEEFREIDGRRIYDVLLEETDPKRVVMELDVYWAYKGGADPLEYFAKWPGRFPLIHAKDIGPMPEGRMRNVGEGTIRWTELLGQYKKAGLKHIIVEHDQPANPLADVGASITYLKTLKY